METNGLWVEDVPCWYIRGTACARMHEGRLDNGSISNLLMLRFYFLSKNTRWEDFMSYTICVPLVGPKL